MKSSQEKYTPLYRRLADQIIQQIDSGQRQPGDKMPTVRELAAQLNVAMGTIKHVYDLLEREGYIVKEQGRGTFVLQRSTLPQGSKAQAMLSIDTLIGDMLGMGFSLSDIRIFIDLKLRQREQEAQAVSIAAVDCSPEALAMMKEQILTLPFSDVEGFLLDNVLSQKDTFSPKSDLVVTTTTHVQQLSEKLEPGSAPIPLVMSLDPATAVELSGIDKNAQIGILCKSERFANVILKACKEYIPSKNPIRIGYFGNSRQVRDISQGCDILILAPNYSLFSSREEDKYISQSGRAKTNILYRYRVEKGSLVYLESQIKRFVSPQVY